MDLIINSQLIISGAEVQYRTTRSGGPGGQHVNGRWTISPGLRPESLCSTRAEGYGWGDSAKCIVLVKFCPAKGT
jgi:hypothetical protein